MFSPRGLAAEERVRIERIDRAAALGDAGVKTLLEFLSDPSWAVRRWAVAALAALGDTAVGALCTTLRYERTDEARIAATVDALSASSGDVFTGLCNLVDEVDPAVAADVAQVLGRRAERRATLLLARLATGPDDNVALASIEALGRIGGRAAVESLVSLVRSGNFFRTFPAIDVLGRSGDPRAVEPLAEFLDDARYSLEAMRALSRTAHRGAATPLAKMLGHPSPTTVRVAALAVADLARRFRERWGVDGAIEAQVGESAPPGAVRCLSSATVGASEAERIAIAEVLGMLHDVEVISILSSLVAGPGPVATAAVASLLRHGPRADESMLRLLRHGDSVRRAVVLPLVTARMRAVDDIILCLSDPDGGVRALAAEALSRIGAVDHQAALFALLADPNTRVVQAAVSAICTLGQGNDTERLTLEAVESSDLKVKREALRLVRIFGYAGALPAIEASLRGDDERLREAASAALTSIDVPRADQLLADLARASDPRVRAAAMRAVGQADVKTDARWRSSLDVLEAGTRDTDPWVRYYAVQAIGKLGRRGVPSDHVDHPALGRVQRLLADMAGQVRVAAVEALAFVPREDAFGALREAASAPDLDVRRAALLGLSIGQRAEALPILLQALKSPDAATRLVATSALAGFDGPEVVDALGAAAQDRDEGVRSAAIDLLCDRPTREATRTMISLLPNHAGSDRVRLALSAPSEGRIQGLVEALATADEDLAPLLTSALARMHTHEAREALLQLLAHPNVAARKAAAIALSAISDREAVLALRRVASSDPDVEVQRIAALSVARG